MKKSRINNGSDENRIRIKALDIVIILLIIASIIGIYFRYNILDTLTGAKNQKDYAVSFQVNDIRYTTEKYINVGDMVYYTDGSALGKVIEATTDSKNALIVVPTQKNFISENNEIVSVSYPTNTRIDASGRLLCKGTKKDNGYFLVDGTKSIAPGDKISVRTALVTFEITVTSIEGIEVQK